MEVGKDVKQCGLVVVMEVGVGTRARAMAAMTEEIADNSGGVKRRKLSNEKLRLPNSSPCMETKARDPEIHVNSALKEKRNDCCDHAAGGRSSGVSVFCCSSTGSIEKPKVSDLEESVDQNGTTERYINSDGSKSKPGELEPAAAEKQSMVVNKSSHTVLPAEKIAPEAELEEFFAAAQNRLNERFRHKYNFDIVNDIPLKGRFEWIQVNPANNKDDEDDDEDD